MVFREVSVIEVREVLRAWLAGKSERAVAAQAGVDLKTGRRYVEAAVAAGLSRGGGEEQLTDELLGRVVSVVRPVRPDGHTRGGQSWRPAVSRSPPRDWHPGRDACPDLLEAGSLRAGLVPGPPGHPPGPGTRDLPGHRVPVQGRGHRGARRAGGHAARSPGEGR